MRHFGKKQRLIITIFNVFLFLVTKIQEEGWGEAFPSGVWNPSGRGASKAPFEAPLKPSSKPPPPLRPFDPTPLLPPLPPPARPNPSRGSVSDCCCRIAPRAQCVETQLAKRAEGSGKDPSSVMGTLIGDAEADLKSGSSRFNPY